MSTGPGVTPPIELCDYSPARVEEDARFFVMRAPTKPLHPVRAQRERIGRYVKAHVHRANNSSYQRWRQFIVEGDVLA